MRYISVSSVVRQCDNSHNSHQQPNEKERDIQRGRERRLKIQNGARDAHDLIDSNLAGDHIHTRKAGEAVVDPVHLHDPSEKHDKRDNPDKW